MLVRKSVFNPIMAGTPVIRSAQRRIGYINAGCIVTIAAAAVVAVDV
jgi:hypothetical protein